MLWNMRFCVCYWTVISSCIICGFCGGTVISEIDTVMAALVEYLYPIAFTASRTSKFGDVGVNCPFDYRKYIF